jgi:outer membrane protein OmpA-like peptidoglycan-associated protein
MAEQAQRRAPVSPQPDNPPEDQQALEELRHLIVAPEQEGLQELRERLDSVERRAEDVSSVVAEAIQMRREQGDDRALAEALAPTIQETLRESVRKDPQVLADALFPVMGPAIRKSISETLRSMLESFNEALEHSLSLRGIQWRVEAIRTGKPFAEIVLMHSLLYRVEQVFLIHRETGLVLNHVVAPSVATQDPDMVAGMLSVIQQFVRDSFNAARNEALGSLNFEELEVWVEEGPDTVIAAVIRGHAPSDYRLAMKEALENIQQNFSAALANFQGDTRPFRAAGDRLHQLLEARFKEKPGATRKPRAAIAAAVVIVVIGVGWFGYSSYLLWEWSGFLKALRQQPGIAVVSSEKSGRRFHVQGFRDPLAADPGKLLAEAGFDPKRVELEFLPFYSVDDAIVLKRANAILRPPAGVKLTAKNGELRAEGAAPPKWIAQFKERAPWIAGVNAIDFAHLENSNLLEFNRMKGELESAVLVFPLGRTELESGQEAALAQAENDVKGMLNQAESLGGTVAIEIVGHTDSSGVESANLPLSRQRADQILGKLRHAGVPPTNLHPRGVATSEPLRSEDSGEGRRYNRSVTFKVAFSPASPVN